VPFAQNKDVLIHYERIGQGPLLTICGGLGDSLRNWQILIQRLQTDFEVLYVQNRGAGQSGRPKTMYSIADMADDVLCVLQQEKIKKTHLLGFSLGGRITQEFALRHSEFVEKMILVSTACGWNKPHPPATEVLLHLLEFDGSETAFCKTFEILYSPDYRRQITPKAFVKFRKADPFGQDLGDYQLQLNAIMHFDGTDALAQIQTPTLILAGDQDVLTPFQNALFLHAHLPKSKIKIYENTGHLLQYERQKEFLQDVLSFIGVKP